MIRNRILFHIIRIVVGMVFIASAALKLLSADIFELYIYSLGYFSFNVAAVVARLIISFEFSIGILLILGFYYRQVWLLTTSILFLFSIFLVTRLTGHANENCNCFGDYLKLSPPESLVKNLALILLLFSIRKQKGVQLKSQSTITILICIAAIAGPAIYSAPDFLIQWKSTGVDIEQSGELIRSNKDLNELKISEGKKLVCFFSVTCSFCELASKKISVMANKHSISDNTIYVFAGDEKDLPEFWEKGGSDHFTYTFIPMRPFFKIAGPTVPSIFLLNDGNVVIQYNYRNIDEKKIAEFFETEN